MVAAFCTEQLAEGLIPKPLDQEAVSAGFEQLVR